MHCTQTLDKDEIVNANHTFVLQYASTLARLMTADAVSN